jgi:hypothetical protein
MFITQSVPAMGITQYRRDGKPGFSAWILGYQIKYSQLGCHALFAPACIA